jgi:hypothetical protein
MSRLYFFRRSIELRAGVAQFVVYAVTPVEGTKPDPVPVVASFPENWRPTRTRGSAYSRWAPPSATSSHTCRGAVSAL